MKQCSILLQLLRIFDYLIKQKISLFKSYKDNKKVIFNDKNTLNFISSIYNEITPIYLKRDYSRNS